VLQATRSPRQPHLECFVRVGFKQEAAVGVGHRNSVIEHVPKNCVERQLRMQQRRRFQQKIQFAKSAAGRFGTRNVLDARE
jgi:hypothetical protein